ncbi:hypothetical protein MBLNU459_g7604t2 [Dothideomycetes sp. NU459]
MSGQIDLYLWSEDNITALCTDDCIGSSSDWIAGVYSACEDQTMTVASKLVPVDSVAYRYADGIGLACMNSGSLGITILPLWDALARADNGTDGSTNGTDPGQGQSTTTTLSGNATATTSANPYDTTDWSGNVTVEENNVNYTMCFLESQSWIGSDDIQVNCTTDPNNALCSDPDAGTRIANLYNDTILCSECFLSVFWWRINSPYLADTDYSDYLIEQYQDILDVCNVTFIPDSLIRAPPNYSPAPNSTYLPPGTDPASNGTSDANATCNGQTISPGTGGCDALSHTYGVTTGDLQAITDTDDCSAPGSICVPLQCTISQVPVNTSCDSLATSFSTSTLNVTTSLFLAWNPNIMGLCDSLTPDQYVCSAAPGGSYVLPPPLNGTDTSAAGQQRGGQGSGTNPDGPLGPQGPTPNSTETAPTQPGIVSYCSAFTEAKDNDTCYEFTQEYQLTMEEFTTWNPILGYPDGENCTTNFYAGYDYCVGISNSTTTTSSTSSTTSPYPTQTGIVANCNKYAEAVSGDYCSKFASDNNITTDELYAWNAVLGAGGENCSTEFFANYDYCVGISSPTTTTSSTTSTSSAIPTQSGIISSCDKYAEAVSGDYCTKFATDNDITTAQLYAWNAVLGPNGENCSTELFVGYSYCVGVSGSTTTTTPTSTSTTATSSAIPTQSGIAANCDKIVEAKSGDYCTEFAQNNDITTTQLYTWNPILGSSGQNCSTELQAGYGYCVAVSS